MTKVAKQKSEQQPEKKYPISRNASKLMDLRVSAREINKVLVPLSASIKEYVSKNGQLTDAGHKEVIVKTKAHGTISLTNIVKESVKVKSSAMEFVETSELITRRQRSKLLETVTVLREDLLIKMVENGEISPKVAKKLVEIVSSESFTPKIVEA